MKAWMKSPSRTVSMYQPRLSNSAAGSFMPAMRAARIKQMPMGEYLQVNSEVVNFNYMKNCMILSTFSLWFLISYFTKYST